MRPRPTVKTGTTDVSEIQVQVVQFVSWHMGKEARNFRGLEAKSVLKTKEPSLDGDSVAADRPVS